MNKTELIREAAEEANLTQNQTQDALSALLKAIVRAVAGGNKVILVGFGSFEPKMRSAREGRNPQTGETIQIPATKIVTFSADKTFREAVNK
jgi:DNA-binding protein HU-beta